MRSSLPAVASVFLLLTFPNLLLGAIPATFVHGVASGVLSSLAWFRTLAGASWQY